jgi:methionine-gamma-lyase
MVYRPESLMMSHGYHAQEMGGSVKSPIFQTSTFAFPTAEAGKAWFELAYGLREAAEGEAPGMIYSRLNNPNLETLEKRLCLWDGAEEGVVFSSGMAAISSCFFGLLKPGDVLLYCQPLYGGTDHFIQHLLPKFGIQAVGFRPHENKEEILTRLQASGQLGKLAMIYLETPANPTNALVDIEMCRKIADTTENEALVVVDNTYMGPVWQQPLQHGADIVLYSATKYIGGHSDLLAGACVGRSELIQQLKEMRTFLGNMPGPWTAWLLLRSLETLKLRMEKQVQNAAKVAVFLQSHPQVEKVVYLGFEDQLNRQQRAIYRRQCLSPGAMLSFYVKGGEKEAFAFLNQLKLVKLAVSLGGTESLVQHPATMTHAGMEAAEKTSLDITANLVRLSVGVENPDDLIADLEGAFQGMRQAAIS